MDIQTIYLITNIITNEKYIGQTNNFKRRMQEHFAPYRVENHFYPLAKAIKQYGRKNFKSEILYQTKDKSHALDIEIHFIKEYGTYNVTALIEYNEYTLINLNSNEIVHCTNLSQFCEERGLDLTAMSRVVNKIRKTHKGWTGSKLYPLNHWTSNA